MVIKQEGITQAIEQAAVEAMKAAVQAKAASPGESMNLCA